MKETELSASAIAFDGSTCILTDYDESELLEQAISDYGPDCLWEEIKCDMDISSLVFEELNTAEQLELFRDLSDQLGIDIDNNQADAADMMEKM